MSLIIKVSLILFCLTLVPSFALANSRTEVLGESSTLEDIEFPPVSSGPGYILPDSPFYSFDKAYQQMRLSLLFTAKNRAQLHSQISGERLAELRVMMARKNYDGIDTALLELARENLASVTELKDAVAQGTDVVKLSREINESLTTQHQTLQSLEAQISDTSLGQKLRAATESVRDAKLIAIETLPEQDMENEIAQALEDELERAILGVSSSAAKLEKRLKVFEKHASRSAQKALEKERKLKETTAKKEIKTKYQLEREKLLQSKKAQLEKLKELRKKQVEEVRKTVKEAQAAARKLQEARKAELKALREKQASESAGNSSLE